jgi:hypothetical protein
MHEGGGPAAPAPPPSQRTAVWALVLTIFGGCCLYIPTVVGVVMAFKVLNRSEDESVNHGRELAVGALGVAALNLGGGFLTLWLFVGTDLDGLSAGRYGGEPENADPSIVEITDLNVRDCFDDPGMRGERGPLRRTPCGDPHDAEVTRFLHLTQDDFPGMRAINETAKACTDAFTDYVGRPPGRSELAVTYYYPELAAWADPGARAVTCVVWDPGGKLDRVAWDSGR